MLKATIRSIPKAMRCKAIAPSITTNAEGHGKSPPEIPSASKLRIVIGCTS